jgi:hypothetical protein
MPFDRRFNHMFDIAFSLVSNEEDYEKVPASELIAALKQRVAALESMSDADALEAFGYADSYQVE